MAADNKVFSKRSWWPRSWINSKIADLENATIGEVLLVASALEQRTGIPFIRMDQGSPGLPPNKIGIEAEKAALDSGIVSQYPAAAGVAELKEQASRFVKAFLDIDISARACILRRVVWQLCLPHLLPARSESRVRIKCCSLIPVFRSRSRS